MGGFTIRRHIVLVCMNDIFLWGIPALMEWILPLFAGQHLSNGRSNIRAPGPPCFAKDIGKKLHLDFFKSMWTEHLVSVDYGWTWFLLFFLGTAITDCILVVSLFKLFFPTYSLISFSIVRLKPILPWVCGTSLRSGPDLRPWIAWRGRCSLRWTRGWLCSRLRGSWRWRVCHPLVGPSGAWFPSWRSMPAEIWLNFKNAPGYWKVNLKLPDSI